MGKWIGLRKGAIGPIGDDIPSIFPIVAGVILFIAAAGYVNAEFEKRNNALDLRKSALSLSYVVANKGYTDDGTFLSSCPEYVNYGRKFNVKARVTLKKYCDYVDLNDDVTKVNRHPSPAPATGYNTANPEYKWKGCYCDSTKPAASMAKCGPTGPDAALENWDPLPKDFQTLSFPMAVDCSEGGNGVGLGMVTIAVWR